MKTACYSLEIIHWNHTCQYSDNFHFAKKYTNVISFIKFLPSLHYIYYTSLDRHGCKLQLGWLAEAYNYGVVILIFT